MYAITSFFSSSNPLSSTRTTGQIRHSLKDLDGLFHTYKAQGRVYVDCDGDYDGDEVVEALKRVFGIVGICLTSASSNI